MSTVKKIYNSKPANVIKNILTGIGVLVIICVVIIGTIMLSPILLGVALVIVQFAGWALLFALVIILPLWGIGKFTRYISEKRKPIKPTKNKEDYIKEMEDLKKEIEILKLK